MLKNNTKLSFCNVHTHRQISIFRYGSCTLYLTRRLGIIRASKNYLDICKVSSNPLTENHRWLKGINTYLERDLLIKCFIIKLMHVEDN